MCSCYRSVVVLSVGGSVIGRWWCCRSMRFVGIVDGCVYRCGRELLESSGGGVDRCECGVV